MSSIASPRDSPAPLSIRRGPATPILSPISSARPSIDMPSRTSSPILSPSQSASLAVPVPSIAVPVPGGTAKRKNRAALREYYNIKTSKEEDEIVENGDRSEVPMGEMDRAGFDAAGYVNRVAEESGLEELLRVYARVLGETRALDAEKKALVYDNYNKLITATETIRKMRNNMDPLNPMAAMLDPQMAQIHQEATEIRDSLLSGVPEPPTPGHAREKRMRAVVGDVLAVMERLKYLVGQERWEDAESEWELPRRLLVSWKEKGIGGDEVSSLLLEGDEILKRDAEDIKDTEDDEPQNEDTQ